MIIQSVFLGQYPFSARFRVVRAELGASYGRHECRNVTKWIPNDENYSYGAPCLAVDARFWDLLECNFGLLECAFQCRDCGAIERNQYYDEVKAKLLGRRLCHNCDYWQDRVDAMAGGTFAIIDSRAYHITPDAPEGYQGFIGFGGAHHEIEFNDGRRVVTKNLWFNGDVPSHWRSRLPNNARFVQRSAQPLRGHDRFTGDGP